MNPAIAIVLITCAMWWTLGRLIPLAADGKFLLMAGVAWTLRIGWLALMAVALWG